MYKKNSFMFGFLIVFIIVLAVSSIAIAKNLNKKNKNNAIMNIVLIGAAGSGKGTQGDLIKDKMNLLKVSAGDVLREYRKDTKAKYTAIINSLIDKGQLVPSEIVNEIIGNYIKKNVFDNPGKYNGVLYDGYPRQVPQLEFLDKFLLGFNNKIDLVVFIDVPVDTLVDRLAGRFSCAKCGAIYHKTGKPTKKEGVCDICGHTHFTVRADDQDKDAIRKRFDLFATETKPVLENYQKRDIVFKVDGLNSKETSEKIMVKINSLNK